jgi:hypothetical protein
MKKICTIQDNESYVTSLAFTSDGQKLAAGNIDSTISVYRTIDYICCARL